MNLLREWYIGPYSRKFSTNRTTIRLQISENLSSTHHPLVTIPQVRQTPSAGLSRNAWNNRSLAGKINSLNLYRRKVRCDFAVVQATGQSTDSNQNSSHLCSGGGNLDSILRQAARPPVHRRFHHRPDFNF